MKKVMTDKTRRFIDDYIMRQVQLHRAFEGEAVRQARKVKELHDLVLYKIERNFGAAKAADVRRMGKEITDIIMDLYQNDIIPSLNKVMNQVTLKEVNWNKTYLSDVLEKSPETAGIQINTVNPEKIALAVAAKTYQGHTFDYWFNSGSAKASKTVNSLLSAGYAQGKATGEIVKEVSDFLGRSKRDVATLTRSYLSSAAYEARVELFSENDDILEGYVWVSTLDSRTTPLICGVRDGKLYDNNFQPVGHTLPWDAGPGRIHFGCRSTFVPKLPGFDFGFTRPSVGAGKNYERGDDVTKTGKVNKVGKKTIADGTFKVAEVKATTDYEDFLKRQPKAFVADVLGSEEKATAFLSGEKSLLRFSKEVTHISINDL